MNYKSWSLKVSDNPEIINWHLGPHFRFWDGEIYDDSGPPIPLFSSRHVDIIEEDKPIIAYARLKTTLRLVNGLSLLIRRRRIDSLELLYFHKGTSMKNVNIIHNSTVMLQELKNPFNSKIIEEIDADIESKHIYHKTTRSTDYAELVVKDDLVREVVLLLSLVIEDELYLLVNAYKILEIIRNDMGFSQKNGELVENEISEKYTFKNLFELQGFAGYINNKGASGVLSRHGFSKNEKKIDAPPYEEFIDTVIKSVSEWINYKCHIQFDRLYQTSQGLIKFNWDTIPEPDPNAWSKEMEELTKRIKYEDI